MEFNRLNPFLEEREDLRSAQIASAVYNVNIVEKNALTKPSDFMLPSIDEMIRKDIEREQERKEKELIKASEQDENDANDAQLAWKEDLKLLLRGRKPLETTIKV